MKELAAKLFARYIVAKNKRWINRPIAAQEKTLKTLIQKAKNTRFGSDHNFKDIHNHESFKANVPVRDYEGLRPYVEKIIEGELDVLALKEVGFENATTVPDGAQNQTKFKEDDKRFKCL